MPIEPRKQWPRRFEERRGNIPPDRRAEVSSTYFVVAYVAIPLPVIGEGLAAQRWGLQTSGITFAIIVAAIAALCFVAVLVEERRT